MMDESVRVHVVDDDGSLLRALRWLLESAGLSVATYTSGEDFLARYDSAPDAECIVLDLRMPGLSGIELQQRFGERLITAPIIFLTGHGSVPEAVVAVKQGAFDFLEKPFSDDVLLDRVHAALSEDRRRRQTEAETAAITARITRLTKREHQVAMRVAAGLANKVIAAELGISPRTVEVYRAKAMSKTGARSVAELVQLVMRQHGGAETERETRRTSS